MVTWPDTYLNMITMLQGGVPMAVGGAWLPWLWEYKNETEKKSQKGKRKREKGGIS